MPNLKWLLNNFLKNRCAKIILLILACVFLLLLSVILFFGEIATYTIPLTAIIGILYLFLFYKKPHIARLVIGFPLQFGLFSAWVGFLEMPKAWLTNMTALGIGLIGLAMVVLSLWQIFFYKKPLPRTLNIAVNIITILALVLITAFAVIILKSCFMFSHLI